MNRVKMRPQICIWLVIVVVLSIVFGLTAWLRGAAVSFAGESKTVGIEPESGKVEFGLAAENGVTETVHLPVVLKIPSGDWLSVWADETRAPIMREIAEVARREYGVELAVWQAAHLDDAILKAHLAGRGPDIFVGPHDRLGSWLEAGVVVPMDLGAKRGDFVEMTLDAFSSEGQLYGLPYAFENMGLFRNVDLAPDAPLTWDELLASGQALKASGQVSYPLALEDNGYKVYPILTTYDGYVFGRASNGTWLTDDLGIDQPGMISGGNWISDSVGGGFIPDVAHDADGAQTLFEQGGTPFVLTGPWTLERFRAANVNYAISNFPDGGLPFAGVHGFMINTNSLKQEMAEAFLRDFVATPEIMEMLYQHESWPPAYKPLKNSIDDPDLTAFYTVGQGAEPMPAVPEMGCVWGPWNAAIVKIITLAETPEEALGKAAEEIEPCIGKVYKGMVNVPGSYQTLVGCEQDWDAACQVTAMSKTNGLYTSTHTLPAGDYEVKVALDGSWEVNYGLGGIRDGDNIPFSVPAAGPVLFTYDPETHILSVNVEP